MAGTFFITIKGAVQGDFSGEPASSGKRHITNIPILGFDLEVSSPRDLSTGLPTGKRQWRPLTISKEWGPASVQIMAAMVNGENLQSVVITELRVNAAGIETPYMEIKLTNAVISDIAVERQGEQTPSGPKSQEIEKVAFIFHKIQVEHKATKSSAQDDWQTQA